MSITQRNIDLSKALDLAMMMLFQYEPGDSRAVSDEFVALASVQAGHDNEDCWKIIDEAIDRFMEN